MRIQATTQNFTGYKNVISNEIFGTKGSMSFITAQLDNEGKNDLQEYQAIKKMMGCDKKAIENDVITIIQTHKYSNTPLVIIDSYPLIKKADLNRIGRTVPYSMPKNKYKKLEELTLKSYTLLSDLTQRMMTDNFKEYDAGFKESVKQYMKIMTSFMPEKDAAMDLLDYTLRKNEPCKKVAERINNAIIRALHAFF